MNITCIICSDVFLPHSEVYTTQCGHLFHFHCLIKWMERSKTCPQCRSKVTDTTIYRIYFTLANSDHIADDIVTLQNKLDNVQFQMTLKQKDIRILQDKYNKTKSQNMALRAEVSDLEEKGRVHDSIVHALKDQISYFKSKSKERDRLAEELSQAKNQLKDLQMIQIAVDGTREEVNDILKNECNVESLVILSATLKKALLDAENKKAIAEHKLKKLQSDISKCRREISCLESSNDELRRELKQSKTNWEQEKEQLTKIVKNFNKNGPEGNTPVIKRLLAESPVPLTLKCSNDSTEVINLDETNSLSEEDKVIEIVESDSPYLRLKSTGGLCGLMEHAGFFKHAPGKISLLKQSSRIKDDVKVRESDECLYDGFGAHGKKDIYPTPKIIKKSTGVGLKRFKTTSALNVSTSAKHRKLNPLSFSKK